MARGEWVPPRLAAGQARLLVWAMSFIAMIRSADYLTRTETSPALGAVEKALPMWIWAMLFCVGGLLLVLGLTARRWMFAMLGHALLAVTYLVTGIGVLLLASFSATSLVTFGSASSVLFLAVVHLLYWQRNVTVVQRADSSVREV